MNTAFSLAFLFAIIGEIIIRFAIVGGGIALVMAYLYWAASRYEDSFTKFMLVGICPFLLIGVMFGVLAEYGVFK